MAEQRVNSAANAMQILDYITNEGRISVSDAAERLNLNRSNAYRLLKTMESSGYLESVGKWYKPGYKLDTVALADQNPIRMLHVATPIIRDVANETGEIVHLCMRVPNGMMLIHQEFSRHAIQVVKEYGSVEPLYCTASGRAALAFLSERHQRILLEQTPRISYTDNTVTDLEQLIEMLRITREQGYSEEIEEYNWGVRCIGVPILDSRGWPQYSLGISFTTRGYSEQAKNRWVGWLKAGVRQISAVYAESEKKVSISRNFNNMGGTI